ncbi:hypothetical protein CAP35_10060 [Chitinophagaceae bacterium IBVUCB1]|nr:hypothetical protein CAP35_10060 [Chitinophagaceae bacterium IBVUCB1]
MRYLLSLLLLTFHLQANAQEALAYITLDDFLNSTPTQLPVTPSPRSFSDNEWAGATLYDFKGGSAIINEDLKHRCFAIEYHDSLFINLYGTMDVMGYANVKARFGTYLYFTTIASNLPHHRRYVAVNSKGHVTNQDVKRDYLNGTGLIGYGIASTIIDSKQEGRYASSKQFTYLYGLQEGELFLLTPDMMEEMLRGRHDLLRLYVSSGSPDNDGAYYFYLSRLFNVE